MDAQRTIELAAAGSGTAIRMLLLIGLALLAGLLGTLAPGPVERAVYLGSLPRPADADAVVLRTYPQRNFAMPRGAALDGLQVACRYDFTVTRSWRHPGERRGRLVRRAVLVDCP